MKFIYPLILIILMASCASFKSLSHKHYSSGFYYQNFKQTGSSTVSLTMHFFDLEEIDSPTTQLSSDFVESINQICVNHKSRHHFQQKIGGPKLGFELCSEGNCDHYLLVNWALINITERRQILLERNQVEHLRSLVK